MFNGVTLSREPAPKVANCRGFVQRVTPPNILTATNRTPVGADNGDDDPGTAPQSQPARGVTLRNI
jgi:hypothetical protein